VARGLLSTAGEAGPNGGGPRSGPMAHAAPTDRRHGTERHQPLVTALAIQDLFPLGTRWPPLRPLTCWCSTRDSKASRSCGPILKRQGHRFRLRRRTEVLLAALYSLIWQRALGGCAACTPTLSGRQERGPAGRDPYGIKRF